MLVYLPGREPRGGPGGKSDRGRMKQRKTCGPRMAVIQGTRDIGLGVLARVPSRIGDKQNVIALPQAKARPEGIGSIRLIHQVAVIGFQLAEQFDDPAMTGLMLGGLRRARFPQVGVHERAPEQEGRPVGG